MKRQKAVAGVNCSKNSRSLNPKTYLDLIWSKSREVPATTTVGEPVYLPPITAEA